MGAKPKTASWWNRNKVIVLVAATGVIVVLLLGFLYYQSQRPNYRDLEKAFNALQVPSDWKLESSNSSKGFLGLFCWQLEGEACPSVLRDFSISEDNSISNILDSTKQDLINKGYSLSDDYSQKCSMEDIDKNSYTCVLGGTKNSINVVYTFSSASPYGKSGKFVTLSITKAN